MNSMRVRSWPQLSKRAAVLSVASASDALLTLRRINVDVPVSDLAMPGKDGYELIREIRTQSSASFAGIPAAAVTLRTGR
jgi:CheY-like chemotaxis protein